MVKSLTDLTKKNVPENIPLYDGPTSGIAVTLKTGRREVSGSNPGRACRPSRSEFSVVFSETRVNEVWDPFERLPRREFHPLA